MTTIIALECPWTPRKKGSRTTLPMIDTLSRCINKCYYYSSIFYNKTSFRLALKDMYEASVGNVYLYIASHASRGRIQPYEGAKYINIDTIIDDIAKITDKKLKGIVFGCCSIGKSLEEKIYKLNTSTLRAKWIYGYKSEVDWWTGTIVDMNIIYNAVSCKKITDHQIKEFIKNGLRLFSKNSYIDNENKLYDNFVILSRGIKKYKNITDEVKKKLENE